MASTLNNMWTELQFGGLEKTVKQHLQKVYTTMGLALIACTIGSYLHIAGIFTAGSGLMTLLLSFGALIAIFAMAPVPENQGSRFALLMTVALCLGIGQGPLLQAVMAVDPSIVMTALLATALIFICFSLSALLSDDRKWLALGGILFSAMSWLALFGLMNIFLQSELLFQARLYIGLAIFCAYILYDTQVIVEKRRNGDDDFIVHCLNLFLDFVNIFIRLLIILSDKEKSNKRKKD